jgi:hypothetical protein
MFVNQRNASKMAEEIMRMKMAAEKKRRAKAAATAPGATVPIKFTAPPKVIKKAKAKANSANTTSVNATAPGAAVSIKTLPTLPEVIVITINGSLGAESVTEAAPPADDDVSVCTEITEWTGMTESTWGYRCKRQYYSHS